jgi:spore maturation protein CgeB
VRFVIFTHSLISDWNHGNAHFLRGVATELVSAGHEVSILEPRDGWSLQNLTAEHGTAPIAAFERAYSIIRSQFYDPATLDLDAALDGADIVLVHEWNPHDLVRRVGEHRARHDYTLYFHDTHHRSVTDPGAMAAYDLSNYDGVLAYGGVIRDIYKERGWARDAWTWHEAADTRVFAPMRLALDRQPLPYGHGSVSDSESETEPRPRGSGWWNGDEAGDLVWIGNWGDDERTDELREFLIEPVKALKLKAKVYGVRYPRHALDQLADAGIEYGGWLPNFRVPEVFGRYRVTVHIPRRPYARALPGIPTIRPFEALACGIPLISAPWEDRENLFRPGRDFLFARDGGEIIEHLGAVLSSPRLAAELAASGLETIRARHTCAHRSQELLEIAGGNRANANRVLCV